VLRQKGWIDVSLEQVRKEWTAEAKNRGLLAEGDLISRKWLFDRFNELNLLETYNDCRLVNATINEAPAVDAVAVIRCKDCDHCEDRKTYLRCVRRGFNHGYEVKPNGFCNYGVPKEVENIGE